MDAEGMNSVEDPEHKFANLRSEYELKCDNGVISAPELRYKFPAGGLGHYILNACDKFSTNKCQECIYENRFKTFGQYKEQSLAFAANLRSQFNVKQGDVVMACMQNSLENTVPIAAIFYLAAVYTSLNEQMCSSDCAHLIELTQPKVIIADLASVTLIVSSLKRAKMCVGLIVNETEGKCCNMATIETSTVSKCRLFHEMLIEDEQAEQFQAVFVTNLDIPAWIAYSSGTTGLPKGILLSQRAVIAASKSALYLFYKPKVYIQTSSMHWVSGLLTYMLQFVEGATRIAMRSFDAEMFCKISATFKVDTIVMVSAQARKFIDVQQFRDKYDISSCKYLVFGGAYITLNIAKQLSETFPSMYIFNSYGMTETVGPVTTFLNPFRSRIKQKMDSVGVPMPGIQMKVVSQETGQILGPNKPGEIRMKGEYIMTGYYKNKTDSPLDETGFIKSGDLGYYDNDYNFYITGRNKEVFDYGENAIVPASIENVISEHPAVNEAVVFGLPNKDHELLPSAAVTLESGHQHTDPKQIADFVSGRVSEWQRLIGGVYIIDKMPRTASGKIHRAKVVEMVTKSNAK